jgi:2,3,4,5-tetrahydropyridine-2-carboxylate N-succinyltransferase
LRWKSGGHCRTIGSTWQGSLPGKPLPDGSHGPSLYCAVIVKTVDAHKRAETGINDLLRE